MEQGHMALTGCGMGESREVEAYTLSARVLVHSPPVNAEPARAYCQA